MNKFRSEEDTMASKSELEQLVGKLLLDQAFRQEFLADPQAAAESLGIILTEEELKRARNLKPEALDRILGEADQIGITAAYAWGG
jgi:hypothetical protein